jgi:chromosome condensin MukBEF ATPase and DNA-binding subunit MukB
MTNLEREVGKLEARMETVETELAAIRSDVREIRDALVGARGGWKMMTLLMAVAASLGAWAGRVLPYLDGTR